MIDRYNKENKHCFFLIHPSKKEKESIPDNFKGYSVVEALWMDKNNILFGGREINPDKV